MRDAAAVAVLVVTLVLTAAFAGPGQETAAPQTIPLPDALARIAAEKSVRIVASLDPYGLEVADWQGDYNASEVLDGICQAWGLWRHDVAGIVVLTAPAELPPSAKWPHAPNALVAARRFIESLTAEQQQAFCRGEALALDGLSPGAAAALQTCVSLYPPLQPRLPPVRAAMTEPPTAAVDEPIEDAVALRFTPGLRLLRPGRRDFEPAWWRHYWWPKLAQGEGAEAVGGDWAAAIVRPKRRTYRPQDHPLPWTEQVAVPAGRIKLGDLVQMVRERTGAEMYVDVRFAERELYLSLPPQPAGKLLRLVCEAASLEPRDLGGVLLLAPWRDCRDQYVAHDQSLRWLLQVAQPLVRVPSDSPAGKCVAAGALERPVRVADLPDVRDVLFAASSAGPRDIEVRVVPGFAMEISDGAKKSLLLN